MRSQKKSFSPLFIVLFAVLVLYSVLLIAFLLWGFLSSLRTDMHYQASPFTLVPEFEIKNYLVVFKYFKKTIQTANGPRDVFMEEMLWNSFVYSIGCALCNTFVTCSVAYVAARFKFRFCKALYTLVIVVMVLPIVGSLPAELSMAKFLHTYNHMWGMFVMKASFLGTYFLVFAAIFKGIPDDYKEAGYIDGATAFDVYFRLMLPMVKDTFMTILLLSFISFWNDYSVPLIYLPDTPPLALGLYEFYRSTDNEISSDPVKMAACFFVFIPIFAIFLIFQKKLMGNISMGGLKE